MGEPPGDARHEAATYGSDEELLAVAVPFLRAGVLAGEPTLVGLDGPERRLVLDALGPAVAAGTTPFTPGARVGAPFAALEEGHRQVTGELARGPGPVRILRQVPDGGLGPVEWAGWARHEAALDHVCPPLGVSVLCVYDRRRIGAEALADVACTHTHLASAGGRRPSPDHVDPAAFLARRARAEADPLESTTPDLALGDPTPAGARRAVAALAAASGVRSVAVDRLVLAVSELVTNAVVHGRPPVELRGWVGDDRVVVTVRDSGPGPADPFVGLLPRRDGAIGGLGLWMVNKSCARVALLPGDDGFTVRVTVGAPVPPRPLPG